MLHPAYLLEIDGAGKLGVRPSGQRAWWPSLVVPRALCVFEAVPCRGLAWGERRAFARLQAKRLAPFVNFGFNACVRSNTLMLWFWDLTEVQDAANAVKLNASRTRLWAEPLLRQVPTGSGDRVVASVGGNDEQTLSDGAITASRWAPGVPGSAVALRNWPWSWELSSQRLLAANAAATATGGPSGPSGLRWQSMASAASLLTLAGTAGFAAYTGSQLVAGREQLRLWENASDAATQRVSDLAGLRTSSTGDAEWVARYKQSSLGMQWPLLLTALSPALERYGVVMKELEVKEDEVKMVLVSAGSDIDLPALLRALKATPGVSQVQLRAGVDFSQATFSMRATGYMRAPGLAAGLATGPATRTEAR
jgi:hypothetical protein